MIQCYRVFLSMQLTPLSKIKLSCYFFVLSFQNNKIVNLYLEKICFFFRFFPLSILLQLSSLWSLYDWLRLWVIIYHITCSCHAHILLQFYLLYLSIFIVIGVSSILPPGLKRFSQEIFWRKMSWFYILNTETPLIPLLPTPPSCSCRKNVILSIPLAMRYTEVVHCQCLRYKFN